MFFRECKNKIVAKKFYDTKFFFVCAMQQDEIGQRLQQHFANFEKAIENEISAGCRYLRNMQWNQFMILESADRHYLNEEQRQRYKTLQKSFELFALEEDDDEYELLHRRSELNYFEDLLCLRSD